MLNIDIKIVETLKKIKNFNKMYLVHNYNEITINYKTENIINK